MKKIILTLILVVHSYSLFAVCQGFEDDQRIKHVQLNSSDELYYCMGYLHGLDRAWQMLYFRHVAHGELAEVLGFGSVKQDFQMRLLNLFDLAHKIKSQMSNDQINNFNQYVSGVNVGLKKHMLNPSPEFDEIPLNQAPWRVVDSIMLMLLQSFDQTRKTFISDIEEEILKSTFKDKDHRLAETDFLPWDTTIIKQDESRLIKRIENKQSYHSPSMNWKNLKDIWRPIFGEESGSNSWVIQKNKTKSNHAILANDPHLDLKTPMFWYWAHFETQETDVIGASFPGVPTIVSGTNRHVSWGLTNAYIKTAKAYALTDKEESELTSIRPWVWFKFGFLKIPIFFKTFYKTKSGDPVIPVDMISKKMALSWAGFHLTAKDLIGLDLVMKAKNVKEMDEALKQVSLPSWNFVFADTHGDIGYRAVGRAFKMDKSQAFGIDPFVKNEFLNKNEMPQLLKPKREFIVTANNRHWPMEHEFHGGRGYSAGFRAHRIETLIKTKDKLDVMDVHKIQMDQQSVDAFFFRDELNHLFKNDPRLKPWGEKLIKWNLNANLNCEVCFFYRRMMDLVLEKFKTNEGVIYKLLMAKDQRVQKEFIEQALKLVQGEIPKWGEIHVNTFSHLSLDEDLKFSPEIPTVGDKHSVNPGSMKWEDEKYQHTAGASQRLIVEMNKNPEVYLTLPGFNARYWKKSKTINPWQDWNEGRLKRVLYPVEWKDYVVREL